MVFDYQAASSRANEKKAVPPSVYRKIILDYLRENRNCTVVSIAVDLFDQVGLASGDVGSHLMDLEKEGKVEFVNGKYRVKETTK